MEWPAHLPIVEGGGVTYRESNFILIAIAGSFQLQGFSLSNLRTIAISD